MREYSGGHHEVGSTEREGGTLCHLKPRTLSRHEQRAQAIDRQLRWGSDGARSTISVTASDRPLCTAHVQQHAECFFPEVESATVRLVAHPEAA